jgi:hypothetical protein
MSKSNGKSTNPASEIQKLEAAIIATEIELSNNATALKQLSKNTAIPASEFVKERSRLSNIIENLREELEVLEERLDAARLGDAKRAHEAKVNGVSLVLRRRLALMEGLDEALEKAAEAATEISRIDTEELAGDIAGVDSRFDIARKQWMHVAVNRLASLGLGFDRRMDKSVPSVSLYDYSEAQHELIIAQLGEKAPTSTADIPSVPASTTQPELAVSEQARPGASARYIEVSAE